MNMSNNWTEQQQNIFTEIENGESSVFIYAGAGTGKTTTIVEAANRANANRMAFLAFNKDIATELDDRLPANVPAKTFHALGFAACRENGYRKVDFKKSINIILDVLGKDFRSAYALRDLISKMKGAYISPMDAQNNLNVSEIEGLMFEYNINLEKEEEADAIRAIPNIMRLMTITRTVDFDDMIWLPLQMNWSLPRYDLLFIDEAQDFNESNRLLIKGCVGDNGRLVVVGDPRQAIYGFRGADSNSMDIFKADLESRGRKITEFPLSISWRCPVSVVKEANRYVPDFHHAEFAADGGVHVNYAFNPQPKDMVLCRYNAPLINAFYQLVLDGKAAYIRGKDMTKGLINHVKKITKKSYMPVSEFLPLLNADCAAKCNSFNNAGKENLAENYADKVECIRIFASRGGTVNDIINSIKEVFNGKEKGDIMLSTVHKAKGLEADNVFILATDRMPNKRLGSEENNICYVAITRAKKNLYYCGPRPGIN